MTICVIRCWSPSLNRQTGPRFQACRRGSVSGAGGNRNTENCSGCPSGPRMPMESGMCLTGRPVSVWCCAFCAMKCATRRASEKDLLEGHSRDFRIETPGQRVSESAVTPVRSVRSEGGIPGVLPLPGFSKRSWWFSVLVEVRVSSGEKSHCLRPCRLRGGGLRGFSRSVDVGARGRGVQAGGGVGGGPPGWQPCGGR